MKSVGARRALLLVCLGLCLFLPAPAPADDAWEDSNDSGSEIDEGLSPLPQTNTYRRWRASPTGYDKERIRRFWREYRPPREEKPKVEKKREAP